MVDDGSTGSLVAPDAYSAADALIRLLLDSPRRQMARTGNEDLKVECSPSVIAEKTMGVYRRAVERMLKLQTRAGQSHCGCKQDSLQVIRMKRSTTGVSINTKEEFVP